MPASTAKKSRKRLVVNIKSSHLIDMIPPLRNVVIAANILFADYTGFGGAGVGWVERAFMLGFACRLPASSTFPLHLKEKIAKPNN